MSLHGLHLPDATRQRLESFQRQVWLVKIAEGVLAGLFGLLMSYLAVFVIDRFIDTSAILRGALLVAGSIGMAVLFPLKCHRWIWRTRRMEQVAILLKHKFPGLGDQLLGIVELAHSEKDLGSSKTLAQAALESSGCHRTRTRLLRRRAAPATSILGGNSCGGRSRCVAGGGDRSRGELQCDGSLVDAVARNRTLYVRTSHEPAKFDGHSARRRILAQANLSKATKWSPDPPSPDSLGNRTFARRNRINRISFSCRRRRIPAH